MDYIAKARARSRSVLDDIRAATQAMSIDRILRAVASLKAHGDVTPCVGRRWRECVTVEMRAQLWYNDSNGSTHIVEIDPSIAKILTNGKECN